MGSDFPAAVSRWRQEVTTWDRSQWKHLLGNPPEKLEPPWGGALAVHFLTGKHSRGVLY